MTIEVNVRFAPGTVFSLSPKLRLGSDEARRWLDEQFTQMDCEPLRPTGKLLTADKVVVVAEAAGPKKFADAAWALAFARAVTAALGKPLVNIDVASLSISY